MIVGESLTERLATLRSVLIFEGALALLVVLYREQITCA